MTFGHVRARPSLHILINEREAASERESRTEETLPLFSRKFSASKGLHQKCSFCTFSRCVFVAFLHETSKVSVLCVSCRCRTNYSSVSFKNTVKEELSAKFTKRKTNVQQLRMNKMSYTTTITSLVLFLLNKYLFVFFNCFPIYYL